MRRLFAGIAFGALALGYAAPGSAAIITFDVHLTFDPNSTPTSTLGAAGPGTVTGTLTIDTTKPFDANLVAVDLTENSNNGTVLSGFSGTTSQLFDTVTPYDVIFFGSPVTEFPATSSGPLVGSAQYERVSFSSPPVIDSIQLGRASLLTFPFPPAGA